jgi:hypothetical protein
MIDLKCPKCDRIQLDQLERDEDRSRPVCCEQPMERVFLPTNRGQVIGDDIPGGLEIKNGLCNADGTPRRYYSKSEIAREAAKRGYVNHVTHVPSPGSDKSRKGLTSKWV